MPEVPWPNQPVEAELWWQELDTSPQLEGSQLGNLKFVGPDGHKAIIPVTREDSNVESARVHTNVWHIEVIGNTATVSPSIHFIGHFHSPNPVQFKLVKSVGSTGGVMNDGS